MDAASPDRIRAALIEARDTLAQTRKDRDALVRAGDQAGLPKIELAELAGLSRQSVYDILRRGQ